MLDDIREKSNILSTIVGMKFYLSFMSDRTHLVMSSVKGTMCIRFKCVLTLVITIW